MTGRLGNERETTMTTSLFAPIALALLHGGHGVDGDSPNLLLRRRAPRR